jgi:MFS transporter, DHA1 family, multidrug resistance protein
LEIRQRAGDWYRRNRVLTWICAIILVNQLGFGSIIPVVPLYAATFGVSQALIGLTIAVYGFARFSASMPAGWIADLAGRRWSLATGGFVTVLGNVLCGVAPTYEIFLVGRFVAGTGAAMVLTSGQIILADITTRETRGRTMAIYQGVFLFAVGFGPLPGGLLAQYGGLALPFFVYAVLGAGVTLLALARLEETRQVRHAGDAGRPQRGFASQVRLIVADKAFLMVCIVSFASFFARTGGLFNLIPVRAQTVMGLAPGQIGLGLAMVSIVSLVLAYPSGALVDRFGRKVVIVPSTIVTGLSLAMFAFSTNLTWFLISCFVWAVGGGISGPAPAAYAADVAPRGMQAAAMGTYRMMSDSGYVFGPALLGFSADWFGAGTSLVGTAVFVVLAGMAFGLLAPETYRRAKREEPARADGATSSTAKPVQGTPQSGRDST